MRFHAMYPLKSTVWSISPTNVTSWLTEQSYAHRGLHGPRTGYIENSLSAFNAAIEHSFGFELDVLMCQDKRAIVIHDNALKRLTGIDQNVGDLTAQELEHLKLVGSNDTVPTLEKILNEVAGKVPILIEIKGDQHRYQEIAEAVWQDIKAYNGAVAIMSFYPQIITHFQDNYPHVVRGLVATSLNDGGLPSHYFDESYQIQLIEDLAVNFIAYDIRALPNKVTEYCQSKDIYVLTWTVRSDEQRTNAHKNTDAIIFEYE